MTRARNIAGFSTITTTPSPVHVGPIGVLTATRIDGEFNLVDLDTRDITAQGIGVTNLQVSGITTGLNVSGIITAQNGINFNGTSTGLNVSGIGTIATLDVNGNGDISGNLTVGGVLTYEDVTRVDSVGVITAREQVHVGTGVSIAAGGLNVTAGISTFGANIEIADKIRHNGDDNTAIRFPAADTFTIETGGTERVRVDSSGDFGIGMTASGVRLDVYSSSASDIARFSGPNSAGLTIRNDTANELQLHTAPSDALIFGTNGENERMRIDSGGRLLLGGTTHQEVYGTSKLQIAGTTGATSTMSLLRHGNSPYMVLGSSGGSSLGAVTALSSGDRIGQVTFAGADGTDINTHAASIAAYVDGSVSSNTVPATIAFQVGTSEASQVRIDSSGRLLIRGQATFDSTSLTHRLQVKSQNDSYNTAFIGRNGDHIATLQFFQSDASTETARIIADASTLDIRSQSDVSIQTGGANDRLRILSTGEMGLGTATPPTGSFTIRLTETPELNLYSTQHAQNNNCKLNFGIGQSASVSGNTGARIEMNIPNAGGAMTGELKFHTNEGDSLEERLRISSTGVIYPIANGQTFNSTTLPNGHNVQINTTSSSHGFSVTRYSGSYGPYALNIGRSRNDTIGTNTLVNEGDDLGHITWYGADGTDFNQAAAISVQVDGTPSGGDDMPGRLVFKTTPDGSGTPTDRVVIKSTGRMQVNLPSTSGSSSVISNEQAIIGTKHIHTVYHNFSSTNSGLDVNNTIPTNSAGTVDIMGGWSNGNGIIFKRFVWCASGDHAISQVFSTGASRYGVSVSVSTPTMSISGDYVNFNFTFSDSQGSKLEKLKIHFEYHKQFYV